MTMEREVVRLERDVERVAVRDLGVMLSDGHGFSCVGCWFFRNAFSKAELVFWREIVISLFWSCPSSRQRIQRTWQSRGVVLQDYCLL